MVTIKKYTLSYGNNKKKITCHMVTIKNTLSCGNRGSIKEQKLINIVLSVTICPS